VLEVAGLDVDIRLRRGAVHAVRDVSLQVRPGETVGIVGESGCGKSTLGLALAGLLPGSAVARGSIRLGGRELVGLGENELRPVRGAEVGMVFQDPMTSLNPTQRIGAQVGEALRLQRGASKEAARNAAADMLDLVGLPRPREQLDRFPHELSGGMRQRVALARALGQDADVLLMDEPFGALDAMTRDLLHELLEGIWRRQGFSVLFVTHEVREAVRLGDRVVLLSSRPGRVLEEFDVQIGRPRGIDSGQTVERALQIKARLNEEVMRHVG
jgi:ABC-type glutathione transport system ATPase component